MDLNVRPFTLFVRDHRPLLPRIEGYASEIGQALSALRTTDDVDRFTADDLSRLLVKARPVMPQLGAMDATKVGVPRFVRTDDGKHVLATRHQIALEVRGDPTLLSCWPSNSEGLRPVDDPDWPESGLTIENRTEIWNIKRDLEFPFPPVWFLYTYFDLTNDEEMAVTSGQIDIALLAENRRSRIAPVVDQIRTEISCYFDKELPQQLAEILKTQRQQFATREAVTASLKFPEEWQLSPLQLEEITPDSFQKRIRNLGVVDHTTDLDVQSIPRLAPRSFEDIQRIIRVWASSMERYPRAFAGLGEDPISDLLAATLNATLPGARREVFTHQGKSDIFIEADVLNAGFGPERVFIAETKWAKSLKVVQEALDPQLFGYLTAADTAAVLLLLFPQKNIVPALKRYLDALRQVAGFQREEPSGVKGWPVYVYEHDGRIIRVCVTWVCLPKLATSGGSLT